MNAQKWLEALQASFRDLHTQSNGRIKLDDGLKRWFEDLALLRSVPLSSLVPYLGKDGLPEESIRFFYVDRNWQDALVQGALSACAMGTAQRALAAQFARQVQEHLEDRIYPASRHNPMTGLLLRSTLVEDWPSMRVRGFRVNTDGSLDRVSTIRQDRIAAQILIVLFRGFVNRVEIAEPEEGAQFGPDKVAFSGRIKIGTFDVYGYDGAAPSGSPTVSCGISSRGRLDIARLAENLRARLNAKAPEATVLSLAMQQRPFTQVFATNARGSRS